MKTEVFKEKLDKKILRLSATLEEQNARVKEQYRIREEQNATIDAECYRIRHCDGYDEHMELQLQDILSGSEPRE